MMNFIKPLFFLLCQSVFISSACAKRPNFLFILTDDQDVHMGSMNYMPLLQKHLVNQGTLYPNHFCTVALCCPSRANMWTGRAAHNTNVTDIFPPYGGYPKIVKEGINDDYLPVWLQDAGYATYYAGKLWNAHSVDNFDAPSVRGWTQSDFILDPYTYDYLNVSMTRNGGTPVSYEGQYSPDVTADKAYGFLEEAMSQEKPWFLAVAPIAPHSHAPYANGVKVTAEAPKYAKRHARLFKDYKIPRDGKFNPDKAAGVGWIKNLPQLNETVLEYNDEFQRSRLRALQSIDEMVARLVELLEDRGELHNTYIIYTTDNGYHISQYRLHPGKECGFDTDIRVPFLIRGPGVAQGHVSGAVTSHTDVAPTIMHIIGKTRKNFDGKPISITDDPVATAESNEHINIEYWGFAIPESPFGSYGNHSYPGVNNPTLGINNTYKGLRLIGEHYSLYYSVWCTGESEYYDLKADPVQMNNFFGDDGASVRHSYTLAGRPFNHVVARLDALMMVLKSCKQDSCRNPWSVLHPKSSVKSLSDALHPAFDDFYETQPKVSFTGCELGFIRDVEGPQYPNIFEEENLELRRRSFEYTGHWSLWT